jgi:hypothetical protein
MTDLTDDSRRVLKVSREQTAYDLGYENPSTFRPKVEFLHLTVCNAYYYGQADYQNRQPRNSAFDRADYDPETFERKFPWES